MLPEVQHQLTSRRVQALAPTVAADENAVIVERLAGYVPTELYPAKRRASLLTRLTRVRPHAVRKTLNYMVYEGVRPTLAKTRTALTLSSLDVSRSLCSIVGVVAAAGRDTGLSPGQFVACSGFRQPVDADLFRMHPDQCFPIESWGEDTPKFVFLTWLLSLTREAQAQGAEAFCLSGLGSLAEPLRRLLGDVRVGTDMQALAGAGSVCMIVTPAAAATMDLHSVAREVNWMYLFDPFGLADLPRDPSVRYSGFPDDRVLNLDPLFPGRLDWPAVLRPEVQQEVLDALGPRSERPSPQLPRPDRFDRYTEIAARTDAPSDSRSPSLRLSVVGCGNFARAVLLHHALRWAPVKLRGVFDIRGDVALRQARELNAAFATTDFEALVNDPGTDAVAVTSAHSSHARYAMAALRAGKAVHVEKPLTITQPELIRLLAVLRETSGTLTVGFNRPYTPAFRWIKEQLGQADAPVFVNCIVKGFRLVPAHWYYWPDQGTRIAGNLVHWLDFCCRICEGRELKEVHAVRPDGLPAHRADNLQVVILFHDGSMASIGFTSAGSDVLGVQEYIEIRSGATTFKIDNFERIVLERDGVVQKRRFARDKGHRAAMIASMHSLLERRLQPGLIDAIVRSSAVQFAAQTAFETGIPTRVDTESLFEAWRGSAPADEPSAGARHTLAVGARNG